jgi:hypothetical protein
MMLHVQNTKQNEIYLNECRIYGERYGEIPYSRTEIHIHLSQQGSGNVKE